MNTPLSPASPPNPSLSEESSNQPVALPREYSDEELVKRLPGFINQYATVNGIRLHYVAGGSGRPLICLPGWPQTWYSFHPVAAELARHYRVILVDYRGMGTSDKPETGYDKKTMAHDVYELVQQLGLGTVSLLGHDIGGMVASSFAYNHPEATEKLIIVDGTHPSEGMMQMPILPAPGTFGPQMDGQQPYIWWMAFNQIKGLPEKLLAGRFELLLDYLFAYVMKDESKMSAFDRAVYAAVYNQPENIRAANAWYQALGQDIADSKAYTQLHLPVLGIASYVAHGTLQYGVPAMTSNGRVVGLLDNGHYLFEENPAQVMKEVLGFLSE
ncbi:alpha/beta hydrolase [Hymenobacter terrestris]|uniref:Alpha/beta hydrolase n=1 Tax=Hymenobacter terrestris TaxID=2748310 RepID=A0ABX2Q0K7_9BACT|nr:alpha/beta hydrolase [Hymenobacter terrestris]NVO84469.1 alpha/beta hydrolase [Hymenobacter terrestris]